MNRPYPAPLILASLLLVGVTPAAAAPADPVPAKPRVFHNWIVACDNGGRCEAASLSADDGVLQDAGLLVRRDEDGGLSVRVADMTGKAPSATVRVDGRAVASTTLTRQDEVTWRGTSASALVTALVRGRRAAILTPTAHPLSLRGAAAAFRYMDDRQHRAGTRTALVAKGSAAYRRKPPALPVVRIVTPPAGAAPAIPATAINAARRQYGCATDDGSPVSADAHRLDGRSTLVLLSCGAGAYNYIVQPLIWRDARLTPAAFDYAFDFGEPKPAGQPRVLVNADWSREGRLSSWAKGRGLGDCGDAAQYGWDGTRFRLLRAAVMPECRGAIDTLGVWRARAVPAAR